MYFSWALKQTWTSFHQAPRLLRPGLLRDIKKNTHTQNVFIPQKVCGMGQKRGFSEIPWYPKGEQLCMYCIALLHVCDMEIVQADNTKVIQSSCIVQPYYLHFLRKANISSLASSFFVCSLFSGIIKWYEFCKTNKTVLM